MSRRAIVMATLALLLAGVWVIFFSGWFDRDTIPLAVVLRPNRVSRTHPDVQPVMFSTNRDYQFTSIKVVPLEGDDAEPLWHLVSEEGSRKTRAFFYAADVRGMKPAVEDAKPLPIEAGVKYRLIVEAEGRQGTIDFTSKPVSTAAR